MSIRSRASSSDPQERISSTGAGVLPRAGAGLPRRGLCSLPLRRVTRGDGPHWESGPWFFRPDTMFLLPGRFCRWCYRAARSILLPHVGASDYPFVHPQDPTEPRGRLPSYDAGFARREGRAEMPRGLSWDAAARAGSSPSTRPNWFQASPTPAYCAHRALRRGARRPAPRLHAADGYDRGLSRTRGGGQRPSRRTARSLSSSRAIRHLSTLASLTFSVARSRRDRGQHQPAAQW